MAFQPVGNGAEVVIKGINQGSECVTTFGFLGTVGFTLMDLGTLVENLRFAWSTYALPQLPTTYEAFEAVGKGLRTSTDVEYSSPFPSGSSGLLGAAALPNNVSLAVARKTGNVGRSNRGRVFWPAFTEADVAANEVTSARTLGIVNALNDIQVESEATGVFLMGIISRRTGGALRPTGVVLPVRSWTVVDRTVDSQRRRLPRRGA